MNNKNSIDMVNGPLLKNIIIFAIPLMFTNFLQMLFQAADTIVVGKFAGEIALAAVGATGSLVFTFTALFNGLSIGANVLVAKLIGSQDYKRVEKAVHTSITIGIIGGIALAAVGVIFAKNLLYMMSTPADIIDLSKLYVQIYFSGSIFLLVYNFGAAVLRSKGDTKRPMYFLMISGVINVLLNLFFVIVLKISVAGVAIATVASQFISAILVCYALMKEDDYTKLSLNKLCLDKEIVYEIFRIGIPAGIQGLVFSVSNVVIQSSINSFDSSTIVAGNSAASNIESFVYIGMMAFTQATMTFTSQNIGANNKKAIKKIFNTSMLLTVVVSITLSFLVWFFGEQLLSLYTNEDVVINVGKIRLTYIVLPLVFNATLDIIVASMRGMGFSTPPTILMIIGICGIRLLWLWVAFPINPCLEMIYVCFPISWIISTIIEHILWINCHKKVMAEI